MVLPMGYALLRNIREPLVISLKDVGSHTTLPPLCDELGLPVPDSEGSKRDRIVSSFNALEETELSVVAWKLLRHHAWY